MKGPAGVTLGLGKLQKGFGASHPPSPSLSPKGSVCN